MLAFSQPENLATLLAVQLFSEQSKIPETTKPGVVLNISCCQQYWLPLEKEFIGCEGQWFKTHSVISQLNVLGYGLNFSRIQGSIFQFQSFCEPDAYRLYGR